MQENVAVNAKFVELLMHGDLFVRDKYVANLGSQAGCIGITAILMGATKVLFAD